MGDFYKDTNIGYTKNLVDKILNEVKKVMIGQDSFLELVISAFISGGHVLIEGVPGLGKTFAAKAVARTIDADFKRVSFTPDLMPSDITGSKIFDMKNTEFYTRQGPVFTNIFFADEINRTPPKTQAALLEAMEERTVTIDGVTHDLPFPFMTVATQNPVEYEGTYPLPEAQIDRFLMKINIDYMGQNDEDRLLDMFANTNPGQGLDIKSLAKVCSIDELMLCRNEIKKVTVDASIINYITSVVFATRSSAMLSLGASPRASIAFLNVSRTIAAIAGRDFVTPEDVKEIALPVLRHRVILKPESTLDGISVEDVLKKILDNVEVPR